MFTFFESTPFKGQNIKFVSFTMIAWPCS